MAVHQFSMVPKINIPRSRFDRSHTHKTTGNAGKLIPILCDSVLPGDTFTLRTNIFARMATLISPIMDDIWVDTFYFFVPLRLVWNNFEKFMGAQDNPGDSIDYVVPQAFKTNTYGSVDCQSIADYFGIRIGNYYGTTQSKCNFSALPFRAYYLIWNEFFRDENLQDSVPVAKGDVGVYENDVYNVNGFKALNQEDSCLPRGKRFDYFSSALPWPLKDGMNVDLPLGGTISVSGFQSVANSGYVPLGNKQFDGLDYEYIDPYTRYAKIPGLRNDSNDSVIGNIDVSKIASVDSELTGDLSASTSVTIEQLRQSFMIQRFLERAAITGTRYTEIIRGFFGVISPDGRLQRPEYLGGSSYRLDINAVPQTSASDATTPQGNLAAFGSGVVSNGNGFTKSFTEHGYIIGLISVRAPLIYQQGLPRDFSKKTRFDFYWPQFSHLGEQAILNKEIYVQGTSDDDEVFGYQERYAEYRYFPSMVTGKFRSDYAYNLDFWHLAQDFESLPTLSNQFIQDNPPIDRVIAVPSEPQFLFDIYFDYKCIRPMPVYGVPGLGERF